MNFISANFTNDLQIHLDRLITWLGSLDNWLVYNQLASPTWSRILIAEATNVTFGAIDMVPRSALASPDEYAARFEAHLGAGHSWINLNAAGIVGDALLVIIELPGYANAIPEGKTAVNLSGPSAHSLANFRIAD